MAYRTGATDRWGDSAIPGDSALLEYCEMLSSIPTPIIVKSSEEPPKLTNGRGTPVMGKTPAVTPMLIMAWMRTIVVIPAANRLPN